MILSFNISYYNVISSLIWHGNLHTIGLLKNRRSPVYCPTLMRLTIAPSIHLACAALRARLNVQIADGLDWFINMRPEHLLDGVQR